MFDDFDQVKDINLSSFIDQLKIYFGKIILSTNKSLDFDFRNISLDFLEEITKLEIEPLVGSKRKELIRQIVLDKSMDKSEKVVNQTSNQIDISIKSLVNLIPPQPYYITQICEMYMNNIGEITNNSSSVFSKVFESNITVKVNNALRNQHLQLSVELIYEILGKIAYFIHFNKAYPISRRQIDNIVQKYIEEFVTLLTTEDLINVSKTAKILIPQPNDSETYRFENKTVLAYFVAKEIVSKHKETGSIKDIEDIICKCCFNICTDVLLFIIYQTDDASIYI